MDCPDVHGAAELTWSAGYLVLALADGDGFRLELEGVQLGACSSLVDAEGAAREALDQRGRPDAFTAPVSIGFVPPPGWATLHGCADS